MCSPDVASASATVATVRANSVWPCLWEVLQRWSFLEVSDVWLLRFAWQAWHFVTFKRVLQRVESRFAWQAQYFCDVFRRCVAFSWQAQHFGRVHRHFSWQAQHFRRVVLRVFCQSHWQCCVKWRHIRIGDVFQLPHRHGDATGKPATRDKTRGCRNTSISYETSSNFHSWQHDKRTSFAASPIDTTRPQENQRLETRQVGAPNRAFRARLPPIFTLCSFKIDVFLGVFLRT